MISHFTLLGLDATKTATIVRVLDTTSEVLKVSKHDIRGRKRDAEIVFARHVFCYLAHLPEYKHSLKEIGKEIGRDHASVLHGERKIADQIELYHDVFLKVERIKSLLADYTINAFSHSDLTSQHIGYYYPKSKKRALKIWSEANDVVTKIKV